MKTMLHISDTHGYHEDINITPAHLIIHTGDATNQRNPMKNAVEMLNFLNWYAVQDAKYKIYIPGNHDTSVEKGIIPKKEFDDRGIILLINDDITIDGIKIWGSPITPSFGEGWAWNMDRNKISQIWDKIPADADIIATHGPVKSILDLSYDRIGQLEFCGCKSLYNKVMEIQPRYFMCGHIHNNDIIHNSGTMMLPNCKTTFSNAACMTDGKFNQGPTSFGNYFLFPES